MPKKSLGEHNYEHFADRYAKVTPTKPHNAYYERPATLSLLPDVRGLRVLDAGCGPGHYAAALLERGADVVGVDVTPRMVEIATEHNAGQGTFFLADLEQPLTFAADGEFDFVLAALILDYIKDWRPLFCEFHRVLKPGGRFQFSAGHPMMDFHLVREKINSESVYYETEMFDYSWNGFGDPKPVVRSYRRPLSEMIQPLVDAGFRIERVLEPRPTAQFEAADARRYDKLMKEPNFICVRAVR